jgi:hypothetical protein
VPPPQLVPQLVPQPELLEAQPVEAHQAVAVDALAVDLVLVVPVAPAATAATPVRSRTLTPSTKSSLYVAEVGVTAGASGSASS